MSLGSADSPLVSVMCFRPGLALAVARVALEPATHAVIAARWLGGAEHTRSARFVVDHARADFLAGRVAAKTAARALHPEGPPPHAWEILRGEHQQPLIAHAFPGRALSVAHSGGVGLALVHEACLRCGVDLERANRGAGDAIATQVAPSEAAWARAGGVEMETRWLLLWTAREAQGKSLGTGLLEPDRLAPTDAWTQTAQGWRARFSGHEAVLVRSVVAGGFVATIVLPAGAESEAMTAWLASTLEAVR